jgi:mono/diheme cytochrome c family protein
MKKNAWVILVVLVIAAVVLSACGGGGGNNQSSGLKRQSPPADYANQTNPFQGDAAAVTAGGDLFKTNCVACHGTDAKGDGPAGASLDPKPANLQLTVKETDAAYMHWVISEGGAAAGLSSAMASYKNILSSDDIWKIVTYLRTTYGGK